MPYREGTVPPVFRPEEFVVIDRTPPGILRRLFRRGPKPPVPYRCGHPAPARFSLKVRGDEREPSDAYFAERPLCPDCIRDLTILCGRCEEPIMPGEGVACVIADGKWLKPHATRVGEASVVICMRRGCGGDFPEMGGGYWDGRRVASAWDFSGTSKDP